MALRAQMAEKQNQRGRERERPREVTPAREATPQRAASPADRRGQQLEYAAALKEQMEQNAARRGNSRGRRPEPERAPNPEDAWCGGGSHRARDAANAKMEYAAALQQQMQDNVQRKARQDHHAENDPRAREWEPDRVANRPEPDRRAQQMEYKAALEQQMQANAARRGSSARRNPEPSGQDYGGGYGGGYGGMQFAGEASAVGSRERRQEVAAKDEYARELRQQMADKQSRDARTRETVPTQQAPRPAGGYAVKQPPGGFSQGLW